jgi:methyl-accepting chemotaxis protein
MRPVPVPSTSGHSPTGFVISIRLLAIGVIVMISAIAAMMSSSKVLSSWDELRLFNRVELYARVEDAMLTMQKGLLSERADSPNVLSLQGQEFESARRSVNENRRTVDAGFAHAVAVAAALDDPERARLFQHVADNMEALRKTRKALDEAYDAPKAARDPAVGRSMLTVGQTLMSSIDALSRLLDRDIGDSNALAAQLSTVKQLAWQTRGIGGSVWEVAHIPYTGGPSLTPAQKDRIVFIQGQTKSYWDRVKLIAESYALPESTAKAIATADTAYFGDAFGAVQQKILGALHNDRMPEMAFSAWLETLIPAINSVADVSSLAMNAVVTVAQEQVRQAFATFVLNTGILAGVLALIGAGFWILQRRLFGPIEVITETLTRISTGDLSAEIAYRTRRDEIGRMAAAIQVFEDQMSRNATLEREALSHREAAARERRNAMIALADSFETAVVGIVSMVSASATELQATAQTMTTTATETAAQSATVAAAAEEAATNVNTVAAAAEELGSSVVEIGRQVSGSAELAQSAVAEAAQTAALVQELSEAAGRIGDVVAMIATIASQTNLLALNATIEAARAGEAGRGFAVVAAEVKELANQTGKATAEIGQQIAQIQGATAQAVSAIGGIGTRIREISDVATSIAAAVEQQGAATQEIVRNVAQASTGTIEVTTNISGVAQAADETGAAASQVLGAASELSHQSEHLNAEVVRFVASVRAA